MIISNLIIEVNLISWKSLLGMKSEYHLGFEMTYKFWQHVWQWRIVWIINEWIHISVLFLIFFNSNDKSYSLYVLSHLKWLFLTMREIQNDKWQVIKICCLRKHFLNGKYSMSKYIFVFHASFRWASFRHIYSMIFSVKGRSLYIINQDGKAIHRKLAQGVSSINSQFTNIIFLH